jgi:hypothetical protein
MVAKLSGEPGPAHWPWSRYRKVTAGRIRGHSGAQAMGGEARAEPAEPRGIDARAMSYAASTPLRSEDPQREPGPVLIGPRLILARPPLSGPLPPGDTK